MKTIITFFALMLICNASVQAANANEDQKYTQLAEKIWQYQLERNPLSASYYGVDTHPDKLPDMSEKALKQEFMQNKQFLQQLQAINKQQLSEQNQINLVILQYRLTDTVSRYTYNTHQIPITAEGGFHTSLGFLPRSTQIKSTTDIDNYLTRLSAFPAYFNQQISWMKQGLAVGNTQPKVVLNGFEQSIDGYIVEQATDSLFYQPFKGELSFLSPKEKAHYQDKAKQVITTSVVPAYQRFRDFMTKEYMPNARETIGVSDTPNGIEFYQNRTKHFTTTDLSSEQIHKLGLQEVARIRSEMQEIIEQVGFDGSFADFLLFLRTDPRFYATSAEQLLKEAAYLSKKMDAKLPELFEFLPRTPYGVAPVPDHIAPKYTTGRYVGPSKSTDAGYYWVNTYALERRPLYELEALTLHEAVPGHHLQISLSREMENTPKYRSSYYISAFGEGWGLYAEWLGLETGFYQDPYSNFGRLTYEMWRALRLVVDTGMHIKGWTRQQALDFMKENSALSEHNITTEVDRYISWPAQALSYKIGELTIKRLRKEAEQQLKEKFDVRKFHFHVLKNGSVPLSQLEVQVKQYIESTLKS